MPCPTHNGTNYTFVKTKMICLASCLKLLIPKQVTREFMLQEKKNCQNSTLEKKLRYIPLYSSDSGFKGTLVNSDGQCKHANLLY